MKRSRPAGFRRKELPYPGNRRGDHGKAGTPEHERASLFRPVEEKTEKDEKVPCFSDIMLDLPLGGCYDVCTSLSGLFFCVRFSRLEGGQTALFEAENLMEVPI